MKRYGIHYDKSGRSKVFYEAWRNTGFRLLVNFVSWSKFRNSLFHRERRK